MVQGLDLDGSRFGPGWFKVWTWMVQGLDLDGFLIDDLLFMIS